jgi:hypothetical protein
VHACIHTYIHTHVHTYICVCVFTVSEYNFSYKIRSIQLSIYRNVFKNV